MACIAGHEVRCESLSAVAVVEEERESWGPGRAHFPHWPLCALSVPTQPGRALGCGQLLLGRGSGRESAQEGVAGITQQQKKDVPLPVQGVSQKPLTFLTRALFLPYFKS